MKQRILKMIPGLAALVVGVFAFFAIQTATHAAADFGNCKRDNDSNAVMRGGACDTNELVRKYKANSKTGVPELYKAFGVPTSNLTGAVKGEVRKNGDVVVGGKVVATGSVTVGRHYMKGSTKKSYGGHTFYERKPSVSFGSNAISAFVYFNKYGEFQAAILTSCGNAVKAHPKPKPAYACTSLKAVAVDRTRFDLKTTTSQYRASVKSVTYNVYKDGKKVESKTAGTSYRYTQNTPGNYTIKAVVSFSVQDQGTKTTSESSKCSAPFTVKEQPKVPEYACTGLTAKKIDRTNFTFTTATSEKYATFKKVTYVISNENGQEVQRFDATSKTSPYSRTTEGKYSVRAIVTFAVEGQGDKTAESASCKANFEVEKIPEVPEYACTALTVTPIDRTHFKITTSYTAKHATFKDVTYTIHNEIGVMSFNGPATTTYDAKQATGNHTIQAKANFIVNGQTKTATSPACEDNFTVTPPNKVPVCNPETGEIITVNEDEQDNYKPVGDIACQPVKVCNPETGEVITVDKKDENKYKPVGDEACQPVEVCNPETGETITVPKAKEGDYKPVGDEACQPPVEECKPGVPVGDEKCNEECKPGVPMGSEKCNECVPSEKNNYCKPVMPKELPHTGMTDGLVALLGAGSLIASVGYYIASRRALN